MNRFTRRTGDVSARHPWATIGAWAAILVVVMALSSTAGGAFVDDFVARGSQSERAMQLLEERFPEAAKGSAMAVFAAPDGERLDGHRPTIDAARARLAAVDHVAAVADPFAAGTVSPDGRIAFATVAFDVPAPDLGVEPVNALTEALEPARTGGLIAEVGGDAMYINAQAESSGSEAYGIVAALVILVVAFGSITAALVPVALAVPAVTTGLASITVLANVTDISSGAPVGGAMVGLGVGIDYALFIVARYRERRAAGEDNATALSGAMGTSGAAVVFAGGTVVVAMAALVLTGVGMLASIGLATALVVLFAVAAAITLLPAVLSLLGDRIDAGRIVGRRRPRAESAEGTRWWRFAHRVSGRPWPYLLAASVVLLLLAAPALRMETRFPDAGDEPTSRTHRRAYDLLADGFGPGFNAPLLVVADLRDPALAATDIPALADRIARDPGVASVGQPQMAPAGDAVVLPTIPRTGAADPATSDTLARLRDAASGGIYVTGVTAMTDDLTAQLNSTLPIFVGAVLATSFVLLMVVFRSIAVPLKAAVMNLLSIGGAYGVIVAAFQWGWLEGVLGLDRSLVIASPLPPIFFAVLFGLSMDYEVFLLTRIREEYDATGDNAESVARGLAGTGRVITSAALIMTAVFLAFVVDPSPFAKMMGLGLATAIVLDATIVRMVLVPATMALLGRANWWLPSWLARRLPRLSLDTVQRPAVGTAEPDLVLAGQPGAPEPLRARA